MNINIGNIEINVEIQYTEAYVKRCIRGIQYDVTSIMFMCFIVCVF